MCNLKGLKGNSRGTRIKKIMCCIGVMCILLCSSTIAQGIEWQWPWLKANEQKTKQEKVVKKKNLPLRPKQIGTPTVQALLDKVKANYQKIQDLKADMYSVTKKEGGWGYPLFKDTHIANLKFLFKPPDKLKYILNDEPESPTIIKNQTHYRKVDGEDWIYKLPWYLMLDPDRLDFYWRLDEIMTKFDTKVIDNPQPDTWVIEAVPKASNPEDEYNYPVPGWLRYEFTMDFNKGVFTKIIAIGIKSGNVSSTREFSNFVLINDTWIPTKFVKTARATEEITLSNIQLNTGIPDSEFEF
ncbi:MAG: hypothetical protein AB1422_12755 [bacterium]